MVVNAIRSHTPLPQAISLLRANALTFLLHGPSFPVDRAPCIATGYALQQCRSNHTGPAIRAGSRATALDHLSQGRPNLMYMICVGPYYSPVMGRGVSDADHMVREQPCWSRSYPSTRPSHRTRLICDPLRFVAFLTPLNLPAWLATVMSVI